MEGKNKIRQLKQLGPMSPEVMAKLNDIMKPIDERVEFKKYWERRARVEEKAENNGKSIDPVAVIDRRAQNRRSKADQWLLERLKRQRPERDLLGMAENTQEYQVKVNSQIMELKTILAQDDIILDQKAIERALRFPAFNWEEA